MLILAGPLGEYAQPLRSRLRNRHAPPESKASIAGQLFNFALRAVSVALKAREQEELPALGSLGGAATSQQQRERLLLWGLEGGYEEQSVPLAVR
jgi:hypothetical protein